MTEKKSNKKILFEQKCSVEPTICEDPVTGKVVVSYGEGCPDGYIERMAGKIATQGISFRKINNKKDTND